MGKTIIAVEPNVRAATAPYQQMKSNCFELFGFDILIEENLRPWLIEVNLSPSLGVGSPLDRKIKADALADLLTIVGISSKVKRPDDGKRGALKARHTERKKREKSKKAGSKEKEASGAAGSGRKLDESFEKTSKDPCFM